MYLGSSWERRHPIFLSYSCPVTLHQGHYKILAYTLLLPIGRLKFPTSTGTIRILPQDTIVADYLVPQGVCDVLQTGFNIFVCSDFNSATQFCIHITISSYRNHVHTLCWVDTIWSKNLNLPSVTQCTSCSTPRLLLSDVSPHQQSTDMPEQRLLRLPWPVPPWEMAEGRGDAEETERVSSLLIAAL